MEQPIPQSLMKLFGAQTARNVEKIFAKEIDNVESFFAKIISADEKILLTKGGQQYFKSSIGVEIPSSLIKNMLDLAAAGKINSSNINSYLSLLPEKFVNGSSFRDNIGKLINGTINRVEKGALKAPVQSVSKQTAPLTKEISKGSFRTASPDESYMIAGWLDQKFYESGERRIAEPTDQEYAKMIPETKSYLIKLLDYIKNYHPNYENGVWKHPITQKPSKTERELVNNAVVNMWGGLGRPGPLTRRKIYDNLPTPPLPIPTKAVEDNLNSIYPTSSQSMYGKGKNFWSSTN